MKKAQKRAIGVGLAALAATAAGAYLLSDKKNRKKASAWAKRAKREVFKEISHAGATTQHAYNKAVDSVMENYKNVKTLDTAAVMALGAELKSHWDAIQRDIKSLAKKRVPAKRKPAAKSRKK